MSDGLRRALGAVADTAGGWLTTLRDRAHQRLGIRVVPVWHHPAYRLPIHDVREAVGIEPRRADLALWAMHATRNRRRVVVHEATRASWSQLACVHTSAHLEALTRPLSLSQMFGLHRDDFPVDAVLATVRLATGATVAAARHVVRERGPAVNLLGGFHHAAPDRGAGLCPVNDVAVAVAVLRRDGFTGRVVVLDLDAHPPDGTAACLAHDPAAWIGSISGSDWGPLPDAVDETVLPDADDRTYLAALDALLARAPRPDLAFVLAGGDVLASDRLGRLQLTEAGARERDARVARWLGDTPAVWLPAGGYQSRAWRVIVNTVGVLSGPGWARLPDSFDPVASRFSWLSTRIEPATLGAPTPADDDAWITQADVDAMFGASAGPPRLLGFYTASGIEQALHAFGVLQVLRGLGYRRFEVELATTPTGDRARLFGQAGGARHLLFETILRIEPWHGRRVLVLEWMTMRHPLGAFPADRPQLPGQEVPGLGLAEEAVQLLVRVRDRLGLDGILLRPAWYHTAAMSSRAFRFEDPDAQGTFEALRRDLGHLPLAELSTAVAEGRARKDGVPWSWDASELIAWRDPPPYDRARVRAVRDATHFTLGPPAPATPSAPPPAAG